MVMKPGVRVNFSIPCHTVGNCHMQVICSDILSLKRQMWKCCSHDKPPIGFFEALNLAPLSKRRMRVFACSSVQQLLCHEALESMYFTRLLDKLVWGRDNLARFLYSLLLSWGSWKQFILVFLSSEWVWCYGTCSNSSIISLRGHKKWVSRIIPLWWIKFGHLRWRANALTISLTALPLAKWKYVHYPPK